MARFIGKVDVQSMDLHGACTPLTYHSIIPLLARNSMKTSQESVRLHMCEVSNGCRQSLHFSPTDAIIRITYVRSYLQGKYPSPIMPRLTVFSTLSSPPSIVHL